MSVGLHSVVTHSGCAGLAAEALSLKRWVLKMVDGFLATAR